MMTPNDASNPALWAVPEESTEVLSLRALIVDDTAEIRALVALALDDVGIVVVAQAGDGQAGLAAAIEHLPDVIVLDVAMPVMDGLQALPHLRAALPAATIVMLSGFAASMASAGALAAGADGYVEKGHLDELVSTVLRLAGRPLPSARADTPAPAAMAMAGGAAATEARSTSPPPLPEPTTPALTGPLQSAGLLPRPRRPVVITGSSEGGDQLDAGAGPTPDHQVQVPGELGRVRAKLDQLTYLVSHDLAEPVHVITAFTERLATRWRTADQADRDFLAFISDAATRLESMLDDLLAYARAGHDQPPLSTVDLPAVLASVLSGLEGRISATAATVHVGELPAALRTSRLVLTQVLQNLLVNALTFTDPNRPPVIDIEVVQEGFGWAVRVADNGIGIAETDRQRIFVPFKRLHSREAYPGNGIGLALCAQLLDTVGGSISVETNPPTGSIFCMRLPDSPEGG